jgi:hypothetical protein
VSAWATLPAIEPLPSTTNAVIEDRNRAHGATFGRVQTQTALEPDE